MLVNGWFWNSKEIGLSPPCTLRRGIAHLVGGWGALGQSAHYWGSLTHPPGRIQARLAGGWVAPHPPTRRATPRCRVLPVYTVGKDQLSLSHKPTARACPLRTSVYLSAFQILSLDLQSRWAVDQKKTDGDEGSAPHSPKIRELYEKRQIIDEEESSPHFVFAASP